MKGLKGGVTEMEFAATKESGLLLHVLPLERVERRSELLCNDIAAVVSEMLFRLIEFYTLLKGRPVGQRFPLLLSLYLKENRIKPATECFLLMRKVIAPRICNGEMLWETLRTGSRSCLTNTRVCFLNGIKRGSWCRSHGLMVKSEWEGSFFGFGLNSSPVANMQHQTRTSLSRTNALGRFLSREKEIHGTIRVCQQKNTN